MSYEGIKRNKLRKQNKKRHSSGTIGQGVKESRNLENIFNKKLSRVLPTRQRGHYHTPNNNPPPASQVSSRVGSTLDETCGYRTSLAPAAAACSADSHPDLEGANFSRSAFLSPIAGCAAKASRWSDRLIRRHHQHLFAKRSKHIEV